MSVRRKNEKPLTHGDPCTVCGRTLDDDSFWHPLSLAELIRAQGVRPFTFPEPLDDDDSFDVDEFLAGIYGDRKAR